MSKFNLSAFVGGLFGGCQCEDCRNGCSSFCTNRKQKAEATAVPPELKAEAERRDEVKRVADLREAQAKREADLRDTLVQLQRDIINDAQRAVQYQKSRDAAKAKREELAKAGAWMLTASIEELAKGIPPEAKPQTQTQTQTHAPAPAPAPAPTKEETPTVKVTQTQTQTQTQTVKEDKGPNPHDCVKALVAAGIPEKDANLLVALNATGLARANKELVAKATPILVGLGFKPDVWKPLLTQVIEETKKCMGVVEAGPTAPVKKSAVGVTNAEPTAPINISPPVYDLMSLVHGDDDDIGFDD